MTCWTGPIDLHQVANFESSGAFLSYREFVQELKRRNFIIRATAIGDGQVRFVVTGIVNGLPFGMDAVMPPPNPNKNYSQELEIFWFSLGIAIQNTFKGTA